MNGLRRAVFMWSEDETELWGIRFPDNFKQPHTFVNVPFSGLMPIHPMGSNVRFEFANRVLVEQHDDGYLIHLPYEKDGEDELGYTFEGDTLEEAGDDTVDKLRKMRRWFMQFNAPPITGLSMCLN